MEDDLTTKWTKDHRSNENILTSKNKSENVRIFGWGNEILL